MIVLQKDARNWQLRSLLIGHERRDERSWQQEFIKGHEVGRTNMAAQEFSNGHEMTS